MSIINPPLASPPEQPARPPWATDIPPGARVELAQFLSAWARFFYAAADARLTARRGLSPSASLRLGFSMVRAAAECAELYADVVQAPGSDLSTSFTDVGMKVGQI
jgi:hypothetical protein